MSTETLHCTAGDHKWEREIKRGRKPKSCPDCKNKPKPKSQKKKVDEQTLKAAEVKYKQRTQMSGKFFRPIGEPRKKELASGKVLTSYEGFETGDGEVREGSYVKEKGMSGQYKFLSLIVREDGTAYANLMGVSGVYGGKHRAIGVENLTI